MAKKLQRTELERRDETLDYIPEEGERAIARSTLDGIGMGQTDPQVALKQALERTTRILPKIHNIKEPGGWVDGLLVGPGSNVEVTRPDGEVVEVPTYVFNLGGKYDLALMGSAQLNKELPALYGRRVRVTYMAEGRTNAGNRVKDFLIEVYKEEPL